MTGLFFFYTILTLRTLNKEIITILAYLVATDGSLPIQRKNRFYYTKNVAQRKQKFSFAEIAQNLRMEIQILRQTFNS